MSEHDETRVGPSSSAPFSQYASSKEEQPPVINPTSLTTDVEKGEVNRKGKEDDEGARCCGCIVM